MKIKLLFLLNFCLLVPSIFAMDDANSNDSLSKFNFKDTHEDEVLELISGDEEDVDSLHSQIEDAKTREFALDYEPNILMLGKRKRARLQPDIRNVSFFLPDAKDEQDPENQRSLKLRRRPAVNTDPIDNPVEQPAVTLTPSNPAPVIKSNRRRNLLAGSSLTVLLCVALRIYIKKNQIQENIKEDNLANKA